MKFNSIHKLLTVLVVTIFHLTINAAIHIQNSNDSFLPEIQGRYSLTMSQGDLGHENIEQCPRNLDLIYSEKDFSLTMDCTDFNPDQCLTGPYLHFEKINQGETVAIDNVITSRQHTYLPSGEIYETFKKIEFNTNNNWFKYTFTDNHIQFYCTYIKLP